MAADELTRPLGLEPRRQRQGRLPLLLLAAPTLVIAIGGAIFALHRSGYLWSGDTSTVAAIDGAASERTGSVAKPSPPRTLSGDTSSGLTEIVPDGTIADLGDGEVVIHDPSAPQPVRLAAAPLEGLVEESSFGTLPRIADDGTRPMDAYARPAASASGMHRVAIVIGGVGIDGEASQSAISALPGEVTLAFAPYGEDLGPALADARAAGHEILLQLPLEPYNYPDIDPGPQTLTTDASPAENLERLHWLMSRLTTYVGMVNYMGGRFAGDAEALAPVLAEIGSRGLLYLDDGSSGARSRVGEAASGRVPFLQADIVLDADTTAAAIDARLDQLAAIARERGYAIGTGSAFPATVARIAEFARRAEEHGIVLVPITSLAKAGRS
jgi:polysaccharide deacetylase 2 family uncharacterized protein YibQ